ncbi:hypothetical protein DM860_008668 [Cuscuta australis]|uniref:tRNA-uridine aminocarboxypropyltransferase n=1 Tax=Cuscuta australis TaxID=267555 RepID=A0A328D758_9ASTE|nr:hypothetical protein DM860_008668 [Cuscuta australis]
MATQSGPTGRRPMCPTCSKPTRLCLCTRFKMPKLKNSVSVTVLQHSLEKNHPLNSTRIASIALQNLTVIPVSDVNFQARFSIRPLHSSDLEPSEIPVVFTVEKYGKIKSFRVTGNGSPPECDLDQLLASRNGVVDDLDKGFVVKKFQMKEFNGSTGFEERAEFEITVPQGSVLLFPSEKSVGIEEGMMRRCEVKNLIVLDGTWAKAKRMYRENPWLELLPHVELVEEEGRRKQSLYGEVRLQPKEGCLSTIESIVCGLKAVGERDLEGLDGVLQVFASMVGDQRRCKEERLQALAMPSLSQP